MIKTKLWKLTDRDTTPMTSADATELDATLEIVTEYHQYYQELIVIIIMDTEIERVDIMLEISMISQYQ